MTSCRQTLYMIRRVVTTNMRLTMPRSFRILKTDKRMTVLPRPGFKNNAAAGRDRHHFIALIWYGRGLKISSKDFFTRFDCFANINLQPYFSQQLVNVLLYRFGFFARSFEFDKVKSGWPNNQTVRPANPFQQLQCVPTFVKFDPFTNAAFAISFFTCSFRQSNQCSVQPHALFARWFVRFLRSCAD